MLPMMGGILVASMIGGRLSARFKVYKPILVGGSILMLIGVGLLLTVVLLATLAAIAMTIGGPS